MLPTFQARQKEVDGIEKTNLPILYNYCLQTNKESLKITPKQTNTSSATTCDEKHI